MNEYELDKMMFESIKDEEEIKARGEQIINNILKQKTNNPKLDIGSTKQGLMSVPLSSLIPLAQAMDDGAKKYGRMNWRQSSVIKSIYIDAIFRHWGCYADGEKYASDSGVEHLGHIMACCAILIDAERLGVLEDDINNPGDFPKAIEEAKKEKK